MTAFVMPKMVRTAPYTAPRKGGLFIDVLTVNQGYVTAGCVGSGSYERLKFQVAHGEQAYNYDLDPKANPMRVPINMGNGSYVFRIMERIEGHTYAQVSRVDKVVRLANAYVPYTIPTVYCNYSTSGMCALMAKALCKGCATELDAVNAISKWVAKNVTYDYVKASKLSGGTGYVPSPDRTLSERKGICFDYASLTAAMLRIVGIPCKVVTGYIDGNLYHAWVMAYANGRWRRRDTTMMAEGKTCKTYTNRFIY